MSTHIGTLSPPRGARRRRKRVGTGMGSGHGKTATRGEKGQRSRTGSRTRTGFEGGQMPLHRRLPKRGFTNIFKKHYTVVNLGDLNRFSATEKVTLDMLAEKGLVKRRRGEGLKVLGEGELKAPLHIAAQMFSRAALEKIQRAGGTAEVIPA
jgi:large subunit ribosomal protein L15